MASVEIKVDVTGDVAEKLLHASQQMIKEVDKALVDSAILLQGEIKKKISRGGRGGAVYRVGGKKAVRSAPGEPPKSDTGRLVNSIRFEHSFLSASVGSDVLYAPFLEFGTSKMAPRPYLQPTLDENQKTIEQLIVNAMERTLG